MRPWRRPAGLLAEAAAGGRRAGRPAGDVRLALPVERVGAQRGRVQRQRRAVGAHVDERGRRPRPARRRARRRLRGARHPLRDRRERARVRAPRDALQHDARDRAGRAPAPAPQADADDAGAGVPRPRRRRRPRGDRDAGRPDRRADLLGEPDAARPLAGLRGRPADLGRADRRRLRRLAGLDAAHRDRVGRLRRLRPAVHPGQRLPRGLPGRGGPREGLRPRRRGDRRAHVGRGDRRPALRPRGDRRRRLRPARGAARQALVRRGRALRRAARCSRRC